MLANEDLPPDIYVARTLVLTMFSHVVLIWNSTEAEYWVKIQVGIEELLTLAKLQN